jgi:hypothetical protein
MHGQQERDQVLQCGSVYAMPPHFVDEHAGTTHDGRCQSVGKKHLTFNIRPLIGLHSNDLSS